MEWFGLLDSSIDFFRRTVPLTSAELDQPTNCGDWTVRDVMAHLTNSNSWVANVLAGQDSEGPSDGLSDSDDRTIVVERWEASAEALRREFGEGLDRHVRHPLGPARAEALILFRCTEHAIHGWDVQRALGRDSTMPEELVEALLHRVRPVGLLLPATGQYGLPILEIDPMPLVELLGWFGRRA